VSQEFSEVNDLEGIPYQPRCECACPFVEVADNYARVGPFGSIEYFFAEQPARLMTCLDKARSEMDVEKMQHLTAPEE